jgi:dihydrofolate reductase
MRKLAAFSNVTLDGYCADKNGDIGWAKGNMDPEFHAFVAENAKSGGLLLLGRITYDLMASYWPTPHAVENDSVVAERMNNLPKVVFSRTLAKASWSNTKLVKSDVAAEVAKTQTRAFGNGNVFLRYEPMA